MCFPPILFFLILYVQGIYGGCTVPLQDFKSSLSVFLHNGDFLAPESSGRIILRRAETLHVACPGNKNNVRMGNQSAGQELVSIKCLKDTRFKAVKPTWVGSLGDITCNQPPWFTVEETGASCYGGNNMYRIGYKIDSIFYMLYEACFNKYLKNTLYVKKILAMKNSTIQIGRRFEFIEGDLFGSGRMSKLYKKENQQRRLDELLGKGMGQEYITKKQFLSRGHLASRADFSLVAEQRASFHYVNTAPQWQMGNAGDWAALEDALRRRVVALGSAVTVYTGTYGVTTLADNNNVHREFYLDVDENNNWVVPVPLYFFKVVHDEEHQTAVAFLSINSSYYNTTAIDVLTFCSDICDDNPQFNWLKWRPRDGTHSFCCTYDDFRRKINYLPQLNVKGVFY